MDKSILIIGGAGYIGLVTTGVLLEAGHKVTCLDAFYYENNSCVTPYLSNPNYRFIYGDLRNIDKLDLALEGVTDVVVLAGLVGDPITKKYPDLSRSINDEGILRCIDHLNKKGLDRVIFVSTCSNYGLIASDDLADESYTVNPLSLYAKSKVSAERHLLAGKGRVDYTPTILRFATAFGLSPRMRFDLTVNEFTRALANEQELIVFDAHTWRPYCHVKDFGRLIQIVIDAPHKDVAFEIFNAGGEANNYTKQGIVEIILSLLPSAKVKYQDHGSDPRNYRVSFSKVRDRLGFKPKYTVLHGVTELLDAINERVFDRVDQMHNFYGNYEIQDFHK
jgi:nucleoside-diphosphate-sugar epimerase